MSALAQFQDGFARALYGDGDAGGLAAQPGFRIYRNTVLRACIDALQANFPSVERLVGAAWFEQAARTYAQRCPPNDVHLLHYGGDFDAFLAALPEAGQLPYLPGVAQLDRSWREAHVAADAAVLDPQAVAALPGEQLAAARLTVHPSARWHWFEALPVYSIWCAQRDVAPVPELAWRGEGALLLRHGGQVHRHALGLGGCVLLQACRGGATLQAAAEQAQQAEPTLALADTFAALLDAGAFSSLDLSSMQGIP
ncbi:DNA-binding domain-containing protein [Xanthomonas sp. SI]|uniref:HvfC/BufC N-terminal domain-containing protein n=1 Tax=Xanthomonas sp. SI TaxID=2724123 RepID=UPI001639A768|nr:DNA-binding domain-containing protein [Xanthomonas sp. SI]QNH10702.1 Putative DNA-binding domain protein [Xanthomonas sp. SI]